VVDWPPAAVGLVVAGAGALVPGGETGDRVTGVVLLEVSGLRAKTCPRTCGLPAAFDFDEELWTPWPTANPPANKAIATEPAAIPDGSLICPPLPQESVWRPSGRLSRGVAAGGPAARSPRQTGEACGSGENGPVDRRDEPSFGRMLWRGLRRRCPRCGAGKLFTRWFRMVERCPGCGYRFQREEGFQLGGYLINFGVTEGLVCLVVGGYIVAAAANP